MNVRRTCYEARGVQDPETFIQPGRVGPHVVRGFFSNYYTGDNMTTAEQIAAQFNDDGERFETAAGLSLSDVCDEQCLHHDTARDGHRWIFSDQSVITAVGGAWDIGHVDCWCWQEHTDECPHGAYYQAHKGRDAEIIEETHRRDIQWPDPNGRYTAVFSRGGEVLLEVQS